MRLGWLPLIATLVLTSQDPEPHLARVEALLADPRTEDLAWRKTLFQSVSRLEHAPATLVEPAWRALAAAGTDADRANLLLYQRRHGLPLEAPALDEGVDALLERALGAWGAARPAEARERLDAAAALAPTDDRVRTNLDWLLRRPPSTLRPDADPRAAAHAVLAARGGMP